MAKILKTTISPHFTRFEFICLGCKSIHRLPANSEIRYNRNPMLPTIRPDLTYRVGPIKEGHPYAGQVITCHFRITDGKIRYFHDCTHPLKGKVVDLPDFEELHAAKVAETLPKSEPAPAEALNEKLP